MILYIFIIGCIFFFFYTFYETIRDKIVDCYWSGSIFGNKRETVRYTNLSDNILDKSSYLYAEGQFLLNSEISDSASYFSILETISKGNTKISSIAGNLGVNSTYLTRYLQKLIELDLVQKELPDRKSVV